MPQNASEVVNYVFIVLAALCFFLVTFRIIFKRLKDRYAPVRTVKAQVVDKYAADQFSKIYSPLAKKPQYYVVFSVENKKRAFRISEFSYNGYKMNERGTLKYQGSKLISFR